MLSAYAPYKQVSLKSVVQFLRNVKLTKEKDDDRTALAGITIIINYIFGDTLRREKNPDTVASNHMNKWTTVESPWSS